MAAQGDADREALRARLAGTNINPDTLLATDYLNHFNEIIMMIELVADMPEMLDDAKAWKPLGYCEHFRQSQFTERELAVEAYGSLPDERRRQFEEAIVLAHACVADALRRFDRVVAAGGDQSRFLNLSMEVTRELRGLIERIDAMIHGGMTTLDQPGIDGIFPNTSTGINQNDIDAFFT